MNWLISLVSSFLARIFKDWRRDEALEAKGAADERNAQAAEGERRRQEADAIVARNEGDDVPVKDDEL